MSYVAIENGLSGVNWTTPLEAAWSLYETMWLREPMQLPRPLMVLGNNRFTMASQETMQSTGICGQATVPIFLAYALEQMTGQQKNVSIIDKFTEFFMGGKYSEIGDTGYKRKGRGRLGELFPIEEVLPEELDPDRTNTKRASKTKIDKILIAMVKSVSAALHPRSVYIPPNHHLRTWLGPGYRYIGHDLKAFMESVDTLQDDMWHHYQSNPPRGVNQHIVGLSMVSKSGGNPKIETFPGMTTKISKRTNLKYLMDVRSTKYREERVMTLYTTLATMGLREFLTVEDNEPEDYMAFNAILHSMFTNYGSPAFENWLSGRDISESILQVLGTGIRKSDPLHGLESDFFIDMFDWALMFGWQLARAVPMAETINILLDSNELAAYRKLNFYYENTVDMPSHGTKSDPHLIMPTNYIRPGHFMLPCAVRSSRHKVGWKNYVNTWEWLDGITYPNQKQITVAGENIDIPFEEYLTKTWYRLNFKSDAMMGREQKGLSLRPVMYYKFPVSPLYYTSDEQTTESRKYMWLMGLISTGTQLMKDGYRVEPFYGALKGLQGKVRVWVDARGEMRIIKAVTDDGKVILDERTIPEAMTQDIDTPIEGPKPRNKPESIDKAPAVVVEVIEPDADKKEE